MFLFHFNPNGYGQQAFVLAANVEKAKEALLKTKSCEDTEFEIEFHKKVIDVMVNCKYKNTIEKYELGKVIFSEIC